MNFEEVKVLLSASTRVELRDHAFGDCEIFWTDEYDNEIAGGYSGGGRCDVWINSPDGSSFSASGPEARELKLLGTLAKVERNDETGPDNYVEDRVMPGLTKDAVRAELTRHD